MIIAKIRLINVAATLVVVLSCEGSGGLLGGLGPGADGVLDFPDPDRASCSDANMI